MQKLTTLFVLFLSLQLWGQSYHTVNIDGNNDFNTTNERMLTTSGTQSYGYVSWDATYLYVGYSGNTPAGGLTDNGRAIHLYIDADPQQTPTSGTGSTSSDAWLWNPTLPFTANYHYAFKTVDNAEIKRKYNGGGWGDYPFSTSNWKNTSSNYWEVRIKLSDIGSPKQINLVTYIEEDWNGGYISSGLPAGLFTNTNQQGSINFNSAFLNFYLIPDINPNSVYHLANYQWQVKMTATTGSISDIAYAGMAKNATNGWDTGIDLPKPPPATGNYIEVYFPHADWLSALGPNYSRDFRLLKSLDSTTSAWDFSVNTDKINSNITISLPDFSFVPSNYDIQIKDLTADSLHNVRTRGDYVYNTGANGGVKNFKLIIGITLASQNIQAGYASFNYGTLKTDKDSTFSLVLTNTGDSALVISNTTISSGFFSFTGTAACTLLTNQTNVLAVKFAPRAAGVFTDTLKVFSNDGDTPVLKIPLNGTGQVLVPVISASVQSLAFGNVKLTKDSTITFTVSNTGDTALVVTNVSSNNSVFTVLSSTAFNVAAGGSAEVSVKFAPAEATVYEGSLTIANNSPNSPNFSLGLSGTGVALISDLTLSPASLDYGSVSLLADSTKSVYVKNTGETVLSVSSIFSTDAAFTVTSSTSFQVGIGDSALTTIRFTPEAPTSYSVNIKFVSNDPDTGFLAVTGTGVKATVSNALTSGWNLFSIPLSPEDSLASAVIGDDIAQFFLYSYYQSGGYFSSSRVVPGSGYWLGIETNTTVDVTGVPSADTVTVELNSGWNLLGTPYTKNHLKGSFYYKRNFGAVGASAAVDSGWIQNAYYGYDKTSGAYSSSDTLKQWSGYWFSALKDSVKAIFLKNVPVAADKNVTPEPASDINNWAAAITAKVGVSSDNLLFFGASINATDGFDAKYDYAKPPVSPAANAVQTYFERADWNSLFTRYSSDIKAKFETPAQGKSWAFKFSSKAAGTLTLSWNDILTQIPDVVRTNYNFILTGDGITAPVNMLTVHSTGFDVQSNTVYNFFINANLTGVGDDQTSILTFDLAQNYPNPFNPSTLIKYSVPENGTVTLKVFDVLGNEITTLAAGYHTAGVYNVNFDATGLTSGVYFYTLNAGTKSLTKKLLLTK